MVKLSSWNLQPLSSRLRCRFSCDITLLICPKAWRLRLTSIFHFNGDRRWKVWRAAVFRSKLNVYSECYTRLSRLLGIVLFIKRRKETYIFCVYLPRSFSGFKNHGCYQPLSFTVSKYTLSGQFFPIEISRWSQEHNTRLKYSIQTQTQENNIMLTRKECPKWQKRSRHSLEEIKFLQNCCHKYK